jgi:hypothetical protein
MEEQMVYLCMSRCSEASEKFFCQVRWYTLVSPLTRIEERVIDERKISKMEDLNDVSEGNDLRLGKLAVPAEARLDMP